MVDLCNAEQKLKKGTITMLERKDDLNCLVTSTEVTDDGVTFHCMTNMNDYGKVRFSLTLVSGTSPDRSGGACYGSGRGAMKDGTFFAGSFSGRWKREGTQVTARYIDLVSNGDMSLYIAHFDATQDTMLIEQHSFS